ncbi:MAG TPA: glycosyltransferase 87 family protein [Solirubrobacteraceae bacterium]|nr:glycosyltransferase 87 family protein [Solirubrobacteraceae bacterium]
MSTTSIAISPSAPASPLARRATGPWGRLPMVVAAATLVLAWAGLLLTHVSPRPAVPRAAALHLILSDPGLARMLARDHWRRVVITTLDNRDEELGFYRGGRMVATVTVGRTPRGLFTDATDLAHEKYAYGSNIGNDPRVLAGLAVVFVLMTAVWPLWRLRNLDAVVAAGTAASVILFNHWTLSRMVLVSYPAMIYLALRCAWQALAPPGSRLPATPLYEQLTRRWTPESRHRVLRLLAAALALITFMVGVTSLHVVDVGYAVMEGATDLAHGVLPYGHIPDILHGDTYPLASYLLYLPFAALGPVYSAWDNADATLFLAVAAALVAAWGVWRLAGRLSCSTGGLRAAVALLAFPPLLVTVSTGTTDVVLAAMLIAVLVLWHRPTWASATLSAAAWFKAAPALLLPLLLVRLRGRGLVRALAALLAVSLALLGVLVGVGGLGAPARMLSAIAFQFERSSPHTLWAFVGAVPFQPLAEAMTLALVAGAAVKLRRDPRLAADRNRVAALFGAALLGVQIAASYWNYMYLIWALPFLVLALFPPSVEWTPPAAEAP